MFWPIHLFVRMSKQNKVFSTVAEANSLESLEIETGAVFERSCAGCHAGGGNILQPVLF